jgi:uncharacterized membrane-anchored protein
VLDNFRASGNSGSGTLARRFATSKVPRIVALFWATKALTTAFGESTSDWMVHRIPPVAAVLVGFVGFCAGLALQLRADRYSAWRYWFAVAMVGVFGTMAADVLHVGFHVPYAVSAVLFALVLTAVFVTWYRSEGTLSIHSIVTPRRELFYWAAVVSTFALGTAVGDLTAMTLGLGYGASALLFGGLILLPALGYRFLALNGVTAFWTAYVLTRPVGASVADWLGKPTGAGGVGIGAGLVSVVLGLAILAAVAYLASTRADAPLPGAAGSRSRPPAPLPKAGILDAWSNETTTTPDSSGRTR